MSKTEIPSIRFHGFDDAWEQRKLSELIIEYKKTVGSDCTLPILTSSKTEGVILQEDHFGRKQNHDITGYNILPRNYCTYRNRSDGVDFTFNINRCCDKGIISKFYPVFCGNNCDIFFISLVLNNSNEVVREIGYTCTGTGQKVLSFLDLQKMKIRVPKYEEQKRIASYIETLDNLITLHQRKFEKLTNVKKSMLEKMFPQNGSCYPAVRFKGFTGPWERRKFGDVFEEYSEKNRADLPPLTIIQGSGTIRRDESERALQYDKASLSNYKVVNEGDLIVHLRSFEGGLEKANSQGIISPAYHTFHGEGVDSRFYYTYFRSKNFIDTDLKPHVYGIRDGRSIDIEGMKTIEIPFTSYPEQKLIGDAIDSINTLISLQRRELEKLQSIKKALLEKMFV
jgi:type I restriction enzyme S subunit